MIPGRFRTLVLGIGLIASCPAMARAPVAITGVVRNQTRRGAAADDEVILLRLDQGEEARTKTDAQGSFTLRGQYPEGRYVVRVVHQGVTYDQRVSLGDDVSIDVFDAAARVPGITGNIEIIRIGTNGSLLHVSDMVEIKNDSSPPITQVGERTLEVYLPARAKIDSILAADSGSGSRAGLETIGAMISAASAPDESGHYTINFPLRPGTTGFAFNYDLPYEGRATFRTKRMYPVRQLAVMIPPTMKFNSSSTAFQVLRTGNRNYQVEAASLLKAGDGPEFEVSGVGVLRALPARVQSPPKTAMVVPTPAPASTGHSGARGGSVSEALSDPVHSAVYSRMQSWVIVVSTLVVLVSGAFVLRHRHRLAGNTAATAGQRSKPTEKSPASLVDVLKEELRQLEVDRLHGTISDEEYSAARQALEATVERALARTGVGGRAASHAQTV